MRTRRPCRIPAVAPAVAWALAFSATALAEVPPTNPPIAAPAPGPNQPLPAIDVQPPAPPSLPWVVHAPVASTPAFEPLSVVVEVTGADRFRELDLRYRHPGEAAYRTARFSRIGGKGSRWAATVPAAELTPGVLEYYLASIAAGVKAAAPERLHFASPDSPHAVIVVGDEETRWKKELLALHLGNHSRVQAMAEYVDFGDRLDKNEDVVKDDFWHVEGDYTYRILGWVYSIRLGAGILRGRTYQSDPVTGLPVAIANGAVGFTYGFAELRFRFGRFVRLDVRANLGVGPQHFDGGGGGQILVGNDPGTHVSLGVDGNSSIGTRGWLRLAWNTVPRVPMSFTLEVTNLPANGPVGGRVYLSAGYRIFSHLSFDAFAGYATRGWQVGGPTAGGSLVGEF